MSESQEEKIEKFIFAQVDAWNARDKETFFSLYRAACPGKMTIEYVGKPIAPDAWAVLDTMWETSAAIVDIDMVKVVVNGSEGASYHINRMPSKGLDIHTVELYSFDGDNLHIRFFIKPEPAG